MILAVFWHRLRMDADLSQWSFPRVWYDSAFNVAFLLAVMKFIPVTISASSIILFSSLFSFCLPCVHAKLSQSFTERKEPYELYECWQTSYSPWCAILLARNGENFELKNKLASERENYKLNYVA